MIDENKTKEQSIAELEALRTRIAAYEKEDPQRERERRALIILDLMYQFVGLLDINGNLLEANQSALEAAGVKYSDVIGHPFWETPWWVDSPESQRNLKDAIPRAAKGEFVRFEAEHILGGAEKVLIVVDFSLKPIYNEAGEIIYLLPEGRDITEKKKAEAELARKNLEIARKNEELIQSYKQTEQIFSVLTEALPGLVLDEKYRLDRKIGTGAYGVVYQATHLSLNNMVAVKIFRPSEGTATLEDLNRFRLEGISACQINHPNAVTILDSGISAESIPYLVMELLEGHSLTDELHEKGRLSLGRCCEILIPVCNALAKAHSIGIIHRDIKPDNIFLHQTEKGEIVKVVDFGIAKLIDRSSDPALKNLTVTGTVVGTPTYMSPERLTNKPYDGRSDVYSLGIIMYQMLTGQVPFDPDFHSLAEVMIMHVREEPLPPSQINPDIPEPVETIVIRTLAKDPSRRPTAKELALELLILEQFK